MKVIVTSILLFVCHLSHTKAMSLVEPARCDGRDLVSNYNTLLHQFPFSSACTESLSESKQARGRFCDGNKLYLSNGVEFHQFTWDSQCQEALEQFKLSRNELFCEGASMFQIPWGPLMNHLFPSHCDEALEEARLHRGLFCKEGQMYNNFGLLIQDYGFRSSCQEALSLLFEDEVDGPNHTK